VALIASLREAFERDGVVRVAGAIAADDVRAMRDCLRARIAAIDFVELAGARRPAPGNEAAMWAIGREPAFAPLPAALAAAIERVFGPGAWAQVTGETGGLAMPNLPCPGATWSVCDPAWHVDEPTQPGQPRGWALLGFALLDLVEPGGGATVVVAGSHRRLGALADQLGATVATDTALAALARDDWRVIELTGDAGDVVLMDPRCLHTISANVSSRARLAMRLTCARAH
jgi:hypothetical protein